MTGALAAPRHHDVLGAAVTVGAVPDGVTAAVIDLPWLQASAREAVLRVDAVGRFYVRDGCQVVIDPVRDVPDTTLDGWLTGTVAALVLNQRRRFALHASTVRLGARLVAIAGPSGAGKSTTVGLLAQRGHPVITDDLTSLDAEPAAGGRRAVLTVRPSGRRLHLLPSSVARLGLDPDRSRPVGPHGEKRAYDIPASAGTHALGLVVALRAGGHVTRPRARRLNHSGAVQALLADTYGPLLRRLQPGAHLRWMAAIAATVGVVRVDRPADRWSGEEVVTTIEEVVAALPEPVG